MAVATSPARPPRRGLPRVHPRLVQATAFLESKYRIPLLGWRFGNDALIGLIPVVGDLFGIALGLSLLGEALRLRLPLSVVARMVGRLLLDSLLGMVPLVGDLADFGYRANARNLRELRSWTGEEARRGA